MSAPYAIVGIDHVVIRAKNIGTMLDFYQRILGCEMERSIESIGLFQLRAGRSLIDLVDVDGELGRKGGAAPGPDAHNMDHLCIRVDPWDADAIHTYLKNEGVEAGPVETRNGAEGEGPSIYLDDPEGNMVELKGPAFDT
ncbi:MAG: VOC family protein [Rhodospirillales bacterium]|nr:VOC family protein [Rhodospirillales bacterium]